MKKPVLVVMAAGMGSRYGGLKQIDPVDKEGHIIMDFSIYDAVQAGFRKVVFIIKKENEADFRSAIGDRLSNQLEVSYVFQDLHNIPEGYEVPEGRVKPWGTGHAVLSCINEIDGPFVVINADDYYGSHAFKMAYDFLTENEDTADTYRYMMVGYKLENRKLVADERTAPIVRYIFERYAKGTSKQDIINELATRGILDRHGKPLSHSTLQTILKNKKYIGVYTHGGQDVAGGCEALIDEKTFLKVQEQLSKRKHAPAASKAVIEYLLQGKLYCGYCGFNMFGDSGRGRNGITYRYYACRRRKKERDCKKKNEKKDFIEWYVVEQTVEYVLTPERIEYIASELVAQYKKDCGIDRIKAYEKQLDRIKAEISRLVDTLAVCPAAARQPIFDKMEQLDAEKQEVELDISKLRISAKIQISKEHIIDWLKQFCNGDALDVDFQKRIIDTFINSVYLYDDKVIIYYNIEGGKQVSYIDMIDSTEEPPFSDDAPGSSGGSDLKRPAHAPRCRTVAPVRSPVLRTF